MEQVSQSEFLRFTDINIGQGYFSHSQTRELIQKGKGASFALVENSNSNLHGIRLSLAPLTWLPLIDSQHLTPSVWKIDVNETAYFKSLFVSSHLRGHGWGSKLTKKSISRLKTMGAKAIVTHSWKESPENSSFLYLTKNGFNFVKDHPRFWSKINYNCTRCQSPPCQCTAQEMICYL